MAMGGAAALTACGRPMTRSDRDVIAAGQPAALLIWAVARDRLAGWPRKPGPEVLTGLPAAAASLPELGSLSGVGRSANLEALAALKPRIVIDYGDTDAKNHAMGDRMKDRLKVEWRLIDGALNRIPEAIHEAARMLDAEESARALVDAAASVLADWDRVQAGPGFYYARGADGLETSFRGALATEVLEGAGWTNLAEGSRDIGRVTQEQVAGWDPEILVTLDRRFAEAARADPVWRTRRDGGRRRLLLVPDLPFGWIDRPPSINRLLGCAWLADPGGSTMTIGALSRRIYGMAPAEIPQPRWVW